MFEDLPALVNANAPLVNRGRFLTTDFVIGVGEEDWLIRIRLGEVTAVEKGPHLMKPSRFSIRFTEAAWQEFMEPLPRPGYHDIFAMTKAGTAVIEGDIQPLMANLRYVKELVQSMRQAG